MDGRWIYLLEAPAENIRTRGGGANGQELEDQLLISVKYIGSISIVYVM